MFTLKPTAGVEPTDPYEKAKQDVLTAFHSIRALPPEQQEQLAREMFQALDAAAAVRLMHYMLYGN